MHVEGMGTAQVRRYPYLEKNAVFSKSFFFFLVVVVANNNNHVYF